MLLTGYALLLFIRRQHFASPPFMRAIDGALRSCAPLQKRFRYGEVTALRCSYITNIAAYFSFSHYFDANTAIYIASA